MHPLRVVAMPTSVAQSVRDTMKSPKYGFPAHRERPAAGRAPCRHCLQLIRQHDEELILFTYDAFHGQGLPPMPGPVYIHAQACSSFTGDGHIPQVYRGQPLTFEAFGEHRNRLAERRIDELSEGTDPNAALQEIFQHPAVQYVHVRSTTAGCYLFRVERSA